MRRPAAPRATASGQASVEHAALVALLVVVLGGATAAAGGLGAGVVNAVHSGVRRAICVAGGDRCAAFHDERPCVVRRDERRQATALTVAFVRVGARVGVVREQWSDGRTVVTVLDDVDAGATLGLGAEVELGGAALRLSASASGTVLGGWGRSWTFDRPEDADRLLERLLDDGGGPGALSGLRRGVDELVGGGGLPAPDDEGIRLGRERSGEVAVKGLGIEVGAGLFEGITGEALRDRRAGQVTVALALEPGVVGRLTGPMNLELGGRLGGDARVAVTLDRDGRPRELRLLGALRVGEGGRREQAELRVDLTRPQIADALRSVLGAVRSGSPGRAVSAATTLGRWAATEGAIERRTYRVAEHRDAGGRSLALGAKLGYETEDASSEWRLERAATKPPGGIWEQRIDCVG
ncbi:MAG: hypothetical protein ITG02_08090 [Patulibacter sp.]|nr:hypothetical protein [Patulibacter sp.]